MQLHTYAAGLSLIVFDLFNTIFGEGTDVKVFGNRCNLMDCVKAVTDLFTYTESKQKEHEKEFLRLLYPTSNLDKRVVSRFFL